MSSLLASSAPSVLDQAGAALREAREERLWAQSDDQIADRLTLALRLKSQADALLLAAVGEVDSRGLAGRRGCPSTRAWLRSAHRIAPVEAARLVRTAKALRKDLPAVAEAMNTGTVSLAQAEVIVTAIADLHADTPAACRPQAETTMISYAREFDPVLLARLGRRLAELIDPDGVRARDEKPFLDKETDAHRDRTLTLSPDTKGAGGFLRARLDGIGYATLAAYLTAATAPGLTPYGTEQTRADGDHRHLGQRRQDALVEASRQMLTGAHLPSSGGVKPRIVVTLPAACLTNRTGAARLPDGTQLSPTLARLLSCDADLTPVTLDPTGNHSMSAGPAGCSPAPSAPPWKSATAAAPGPDAIGRLVGPKPITSAPG